MEKYLNHRYELIAISISLVLSVLMYSGVYGITKSRFELLGSAAIPKVVAISLFVLALIKALQIIKEVRNSPSRVSNSSDGFLKSVGIFVFISGFVLCIAVFNFSFWVAVFSFLVISIFFLKKPKKRMEVVKIIFFSLLFSLGTNYLFTTIFYFGL